MIYTWQTPPISNEGDFTAKEAQTTAKPANLPPKSATNASLKNVQIKIPHILITEKKLQKQNEQQSTTTTTTTKSNC